MHRFGLLKNPRFWLWAIIVFTFLICGSVFWVHSRQRDTYERTVASLNHIHKAHNDIEKGMLFASLSSDPAMPYDRAQGIALLTQAAESLEEALRMSSRDPITNDSETYIAIQDYRANIERFKLELNELVSNQDESPRRKTEIRIEYLKLEKNSGRVEELIKANLSRLTYRLNLEFGLVYLVGFLALAGGGAAIILSQNAEKHSLDLIREAKERLEQVVHATNVGLWDLDVRSGRVYYSPEWKKILGFADEEIGDGFEELRDRIHPADLAELTEEVERVLENGEATRKLNFRLRHKNGSYCRIISSVSALYENGLPVRVVGVNVDITDIRAVEEALVRSEQRFKLLVDEAPEAIFITDADHFVYVNQKAVELFGAPTAELLVGTRLEDRTVSGRRPESLARIRKVVSEKVSLPHVETEMKRFDGRALEVEYSAIPFEYNGAAGALFFVRDTSERKRLEAQLIQSYKMESIGRLAGGIAHDFNNLLTVMLAYSGLAEKRVGEDEKLAGYIEQIRLASERARSLTHQLLGFARRQIIAPRIVSLNDEIDKIHRLITRLIGEDIEIKQTLAPELWTVRADAGQIEQIMLNLAANARDAMPNGGTLTIETGNVVVDEDYVRDHPEVALGEYVMLAVSDTGVGIDNEAREFIFEPFFTTKELGKGTGLGLATCHGIVKQNDGHISFFSEAGRGTTFKIYLPRVVEVETKVESVDEVTETAGTETIIVVEDEPIVRGITVETLRSFGYEIIECASGSEAIEAAAAFEGKISLLLTDVVMPHMSGNQLAVEMRKIRPEIGVLFVSGYTENTIVNHGILEDEVNFVAKPYNVDSLGAKIREILDRGGRARQSSTNA